MMSDTQQSVSVPILLAPLERVLAEPGGNVFTGG